MPNRGATRVGRRIRGAHSQFSNMRQMNRDAQLDNAIRSKKAAKRMQNSPGMKLLKYAIGNATRAKRMGP